MRRCDRYCGPGSLSVCRDNRLAGCCRDSLTLGSFRPVSEDIGDRMQSARIAEAGEDERDVAADVPIRMTKPARERRQDTRIVTADEGLRELYLLPEHLFVLELFDQHIRTLRAVDSRLIRRLDESGYIDRAAAAYNVK